MWLALAFKTFCSSENDGDDSDKDDTDIDNDDYDNNNHSDNNDDNDDSDDDFAVKEKSIFKEEKLSLPKKNGKGLFYFLTSRLIFLDIAFQDVFHLFCLC